MFTNFINSFTSKLNDKYVVKQCITHLMLSYTTCDLSIITFSFLTFIFHKVVQQHAQGVVGYLKRSLLQIMAKSDSEKNLKIG